MPAKKILVVVTSVEKYPKFDPPRATGLWLGEVTHFVHKVEAAGVQVDYVSPQGGYTPIDPMSLQQADDTDWQYYANKEFMGRLCSTKKASEVEPSQYAAIYFSGGHGVVFDFPDNEELQALSRKIYEAGGVVSSVCHGAVALNNIKLSDGALLIKDKKVTGFSNDEEKAVGLDSHVPFLTETELKARGGVYEKATDQWAPYVVVDGRLVTGQNPASAAGVAEKVLELIK